MKRKLLLSVALLATMFITTNAQTTVELGTDWNGSDIVSSSTATTLYVSDDTYSYSYTFNDGQSNQVALKLVNGSETSYIKGADTKSLYAKPTSESLSFIYLRADHKDYFQADATSSKKITQIKINGTSASVEDKSVCAVIYSSGTSFDENSITGVDTVSLAPCRSGNKGTTLSSSIPDGTKSFRIYKGVYLSGTSSPYSLDESGTIYGGGLARIGYLAITIEDDASGISEQTTDKVVVSKEYYDLLGKRLVTCPENTISIVKKTYEDGSVDYEKILYKK